MNQTLLLKNSCIFENSNLIDRIRQSCIDIEVSSDEREIHDFLRESFKFLEEEKISNDVSIELIAAILECFSHYSEKLTKEIRVLLNKSRMNSNFTVITSSLIFYLNQNQPQLLNSQCHNFVNDAITEISKQINQISNKRLILFGNEISSMFINDLIINLLLSAKLTNEIVSKLFPYILYHNIFSKTPKFKLILEIIINLGLIKILPQDETSKNQISEFIIEKNFESILTMNESAFSLVQSSLFYAIKEGNYTAEGITEETILPFIAICMIYLEKSHKIPFFSFSKYKNLIINSMHMLANNKSPEASASIDFILQNQCKAFSNKVLLEDDMFQIFFILTKQLINYDYCANKMILLNSIFILTSTDNFEMLSIFFSEFIIDLFDFISQNFKKVNEYDDLKQTKLNLIFIESSVIVTYLSRFSDMNDVINFIYFIDEFCYNQPIFVSSPELSDTLMKAARVKIKEENWDDVIKLGEFLKKNDFNNELFELNELGIPELIQNTLFNCLLDESCSNDEAVDHIISILLADPNLEKNNSDMKKLFELMIKDKEILQPYLSYLIRTFSIQMECSSLNIDGMLKLFKNEYCLYNDTFIDIVNRMYYNNQNQFIEKEDFIISSFPISKFGQSIIFKLFESIKKKSGNYEAFICLKNISSSFPFLFNDIFDQLCEIVSSNMKQFILLFENVENEENLRLFKTSYAALSFFVSTMQSSCLIDQFIKWFFNNMETLNDDQLFGFWIIAYHLILNEKSMLVFHVSTMKLNLMEKIGHILERNPKNTIIMNVIKQKIYFFLLKTYENLTKMNNYEIIQDIEFIKKVDNPATQIYEFILSNVPNMFKTFDLKIEGILSSLKTFIDDFERKREYWIDYPRHQHQLQIPTTVEINQFRNKIIKNEPLINLPDLKNIQSKITVKMARYIVLKHHMYYSWILYKREQPFVDANKDEIDDIINHLNDFQAQANESPDEEENKVAELYDFYDYTFPLYCQPILFKNLIRDLTNTRLIKYSHSILNELITLIINSNEVSFLSFLELISQYFSEIYSKIDDSNFQSSIESMIKLLNVLITLSKIEGFNENFVDLCGNNIINIILKPKLRRNSHLLLKTVEVFLLLKNNLPIRITQIICSILSLKDVNIDMEKVFQLINKFDYHQLNNVFHYLFADFDDEKTKMKISPIFIKFAKKFPLLIEEKKEQLITLLDVMLQDYFSRNDNDNYEKTQNISQLFNLLAPKKPKSTTNKIIKSDKLITISQELREMSPSFWNVFEKYSSQIMEMIESQPFALENFKFLGEYPELIDFKIRSSYFRGKMRKRINGYGRFPLKVDRKDILSTSYKGFINKTTDQLLKSLCVDFIGERSIDAGGPTREWFTTLSREIMNQNYGLFECSKNTKCYQPNRSSDINPNHIEYFKFAGKFIARTLIEGQCIDAHFTTSFYKQILNYELNYKDIEDLDEELFHSLDWMLRNDVDSLDMFFEVDTLEFGIVKTIELKENGSEIKVTNDNKAEYVNLMANYVLKGPIENQVKAFCCGFYSLIDYDDIKMFTPKEIDLLICGIPEINAGDLIANTKIDHPYNSETPVVKYFFNVISKWENDKLAKLLLFMTGSSRVPSNGFKEFCEMTGCPLKISYGGDKSRIPQSHTCFNTIDLPQYESEEELKEKLILAIEECNTFEMS